MLLNLFERTSQKCFCVATKVSSLTMSTLLGHKDAFLPNRVKTKSSSLVSDQGRMYIELKTSGRTFVGCLLAWKIGKYLHHLWIKLFGNPCLWPVNGKLT